MGPPIFGLKAEVKPVALAAERDNKELAIAVISVERPVLKTERR